MGIFDFWCNQFVNNGCNEILIKQKTGVHFIEFYENAMIPAEIWWSDVWYKCPTCKKNFIPKINKILLNTRSKNDNFNEILESIEIYHKPIYNYIEI